MKGLADAFPEFAESLVRELKREGYGSTALDAPGKIIVSVTFDDVANAGYIYLHPVGAAHKETLALETAPFSIVAVDTSGCLVGIEFLSPPKDFANKLRQLAVV